MPSELVAAAPVLDARELRRSFGRGARAIEAVRSVSLQIAAGRTTVVLGPNGAGKTTLVRMLATLLIPSSGQIMIDGVDAVAAPREARKRLGLVLGGDRGFYLRATAEENLRYFGGLVQVPRRRLRQKMDEVLSDVGLAERRHDKVETYSRGMRQRLHIARGLLADPRLVLLDEPTIGLDPEAALTVRDLIGKLNSSGRAILLTTHYLHEAGAVADEIVVIISGAVAVRGTVGDVARAAGVGDVTTLKARAAPHDILTRIEALDGVVSVRSDEVSGQRWLTVAWATGVSGTADVVQICHDLNPTAVTTRAATLEEAYLALVARRAN